MFNEPQIVIQGNIATGPELRYTPSGRPVCGFTVAQNPRHKNPATGDWEDGTPVFMRVSCWGDLAENVAQSVNRGDPILVVGRIRQREWTPRTDPGSPEPRSQRATEVQADSVAVPMDKRILRLTRVTRDHEPDDGGGGGQAAQAQAAQDGAQAAQGGPEGEAPATSPAGAARDKGRAKRAAAAK
jgi:single-strand DNA-binding protein